MVTKTGSVEPDDLTEKGFVNHEAAKLVRTLRVAEPWERYDSIATGIGCANLDTGWFNNFSDFANADSLTWFSQRNSAVGNAYANQKSERTDWAQDIYQFGIQFFTPVGMAEFDTDPNDSQFMPSVWQKDLPAMMAFNVTIADVDSVLVIPGDRAPSGIGVGNMSPDGSAAPVLNAGTSGVPVMSNTWKFPEPIMLPAVAQIGVTARLNAPIAAFLRQFTGSPGSKRIFNPATGQFVLLPNWYWIKCSFRGPRYLQFRGAREAA